MFLLSWFKAWYTSDSAAVPETGSVGVEPQCWFYVTLVVQHSQCCIKQIRCWYSLGLISTKCAMASGVCFEIDVHAVTQSSPSAGISFTHSLPGGSELSWITGSVSPDDHSDSSSINSTKCETLKDVHISARLMEDFLDLASDNTKKDLETCGVLGASLKDKTFYVTNLIIPKQESTSGSCEALHEEQIFAIQNEQSLFPIGWIHTHPSQSCFMSSVDLHTQHSYQVMVPEAVAIVMAPTDKSRRYGIFRLSDPVGMSILMNCREKGFHPHPEPADGSSIYVDCCNVYINPNLRLEICDLR